MNEALKALDNIATAMVAETWEKKWFPEWVKAPEFPMTFTRQHYKSALNEIRLALSRPTFEDALKVVDNRRRKIEGLSNQSGFQQKLNDEVVRVLDELLAALRERGEGK